MGIWDVDNLGIPLVQHSGLGFLSTTQQNGINVVPIINTSISTGINLKTEMVGQERGFTYFRTEDVVPTIVGVLLGFINQGITTVKAREITSDLVLGLPPSAPL